MGSDNKLLSMNNSAALPWRRKSFDVCNLKTEVISISSNDKLSWRKKPLDVNHEKTESSTIDSKDNDKSSWKRKPFDVYFQKTENINIDFKENDKLSWRRKSFDVNNLKAQNKSINSKNNYKLSRTRKPFDVHYQKTQNNSINCKDNDKLSWRRKSFDVGSLKTKLNYIDSEENNQLLLRRKEYKHCLENLSDKKLSLSTEKVELNCCNMAVLRVDGECMNVILTCTKFESSGYVSSNKLVVIQLLVDKSFSLNEDSFKVVSRRKNPNLSCVYFQVKDLDSRNNQENIQHFSSITHAYHNFNIIFNRFTGSNWSEKDFNVRYKQIKTSVDTLQYHFMNSTTRKTDGFDYNSLSNSIKELIQIIGANPPLSYTSSPDSYKHLWTKISNQQIFEARSILFNIANNLKDNKNSDLNIELSSDFYSLIPSGTLKESSRFVSSLSTLSSEMNRLNFIEGVNNKYPLKLKLIGNKSKVFKLIKKVFTTTHGKNHNFKISPYKIYSFEDGKVLSTSQKSLLWHGTHLSFVPGILRRGFQLPTVTGQMFGEAVYFTPCVSKASKYCNVAHSAIKKERTGVLILCEVDTKDLECKSISGRHFKAVDRDSSIRAIGRYQTSDSITLEGTKMFIGPLKDENPTAWINYDEYAVYDLNKIKVKYVVVTKFSPEISDFKGI